MASVLKLIVLLCLLGLSLAFTPPSALVARPTAVRTVDVSMGRGDKRTAKGKRKAGSHGISRPTNAEIRQRKAAKADAKEE